MRIKTGSRIAIVGGGPAGVFFALYLRRYGEQENIHPEITVYQQRNFSEKGPRGCKGCAGILSVSLLGNLKELGLTVPPEIIRNRITAYTIHSPYTSISITNLEKEKEIVSIYRGSGPRLSYDNKTVGFDGWLLEQAQSRGVTVVNEAVSQIDLRLWPSVEAAGRKTEYELIVLANGVSTRPVPVAGLNYVPPEVRTMAMDELYAGVDQVESRLGNTAHGFLIPRLGIVFGGLVPKGPFITVTVLSSNKAPVTIDDFLKYDVVRNVLPERYERACGCRPKAVVGSARNYFSDRFVAIGDAAVSKLYQDGITSALLTARQAAATVIRHGVSRDDFTRYYQPIFQAIDTDRRWGRMLFSMNHRANESRTFLLVQHRLTGIEQNNTRGPQPFTKAAWGMLTGSYGYKDLLKGLFRPTSVLRLLGTFTLECLRGLFRKRENVRRQLLVGSRKVLILGGGFGGVYTLRNLVPALNRNENIETTLVSDENYFLFTPLLHEVALGRIETRHIAFPIRSIQWKDRFKFIQAGVEKIDLGARKVFTTAGTLDFDYLVIALGSTTDMTAIGPDWKNVSTLKNLNDGRLIRNHIMRTFEQASAEKDPARRRQLLTFVVSGAGYTGVQVVTGLRDLVLSNLPRFYKTINKNDVRVILIEASPKIVADLHTKLGAYVMRYLKNMGVEVRLSSKITRAWDSGIEINNTETIPTSTVIWVSGVAANPVIAGIENIDKDNLGRAFVNEYLEVPGFPGVYAIGDCAHIKNPKTGKPIPPLAHTAVRQAKVVSGNVLSDIRGLNRKPYRYSKPPDMVSLGSYKAVFRFRSIRLYGYFPRLILTFIYLVLITGMPNRIRIVIDWLLSIIFGRDTTFIRQIK
ncbi:MAG: FAD-dependent oxidoreductase [Dehalococcoidales bacterium]|nr:FAD-dependent oxidoreductase [Dehalococcoidales bacterium]